MYIERTLEKAMRAYTAKFPVLSLTGPRQAGKTTLLKTVFPEYRYVSLENPEVRLQAESDPNGFLDRYDRYVIFDEAQRVPHLFSYLQTKVDNDGIMGQYILSGSQNFLLLQNITQSLAGRVAIFRLFPFDMAELKPQNLLNVDLDENITKGFYPALFGRPLTALDYYPNYVESYVERDVRTLLNVKDLGLFRIFMRLCAGRVGQVVNFNSMANECGISMKTAQAWFSILETSYITFQLSPYFQNINKRLVKSPKIYFYDTGLLCYLLGIKNAEIATHYARGSIFENFVIADFIKADAHSLGRNTFYFYRDSNQNEIDCLVQAGEKFNLVEIKSGKTINSDFFDGIKKFEKSYPHATGKKFLVYGGHEKYTHLGTQIVGWDCLEAVLSGK
jgi:uncharacterized protein